MVKRKQSRAGNRARVLSPEKNNVKSLVPDFQSLALGFEILRKFACLTLRNRSHFCNFMHDMNFRYNSGSFFFFLLRKRRFEERFRDLHYEVLIDENVQALIFVFFSLHYYTKSYLCSLGCRQLSSQIPFCSNSRVLRELHVCFRTDSRTMEEPPKLWGVRWVSEKELESAQQLKQAI